MLHDSSRWPDHAQVKQYRFLCVGIFLARKGDAKELTDVAFGVKPMPPIAVQMSGIRPKRPHVV
jgi:hypothetical protein